MTGKKQKYFGTKVLILGLGSHPSGSGVAAAKFFARQGATVLVVDKKNKKQLGPALARLKHWSITYHFGPHRLADVRWADIVVQNPSVPIHSQMMRYAEKLKKKIETDLTIFFGLVRPRVVGISGSRGKSTTTALLHHLVSANFPKALRAGNIGNSPLLARPRLRANSLVILELSSWMLEGLARIKYSPPLAILTNVYPDHLDYYHRMADYRRVKQLLFSWQRPNDSAIFFKHQAKPHLSNNRPDQQFQFSGASPVARGVGVAHDWFVYFHGRNQHRIAPVNSLKLLGLHNRHNAAAALTAAILLGVPPQRLAKRLPAFPGLPHRLQRIRTINRVEYINDSHSTTPVSTQAALVTFPAQKIILIAGGVDKKLPLHGLVEAIRTRVRELILLPGSASQRLLKKRTQFGMNRIHQVATLPRAVKRAARQARADDIVLLSPAAASFNQFRNAEERGQTFIQAVKQL